MVTWLKSKTSIFVRKWAILKKIFITRFLSVIVVQSIREVTSMLVTDAGNQMCWWQVLDVGDRFRMLENHQHNQISRQHNDSATNISNRSRWPGHHHKVLPTMSPTSLSPSWSILNTVYNWKNWMMAFYPKTSFLNLTKNKYCSISGLNSCFQNFGFQCMWHSKQ